MTPISMQENEVAVTVSFYDMDTDPMTPVPPNPFVEGDDTAWFLCDVLSIGEDRLAFVWRRLVLEKMRLP